MQIFAPEVWLPMGSYDAVANDFESANRTALGERTGTQLLVIGRLKPGMTATAVEPALKDSRCRISSRLIRSNKRIRLS